jgi:hypothetical protein
MVAQIVPHFEDHEISHYGKDNIRFFIGLPYILILMCRKIPTFSVDIFHISLLPIISIVLVYSLATYE